MLTIKEAINSFYNLSSLKVSQLPTHTEIVNQNLPVML